MRFNSDIYTIVTTIIGGPSYTPARVYQLITERKRFSSLGLGHSVSRNLGQQTVFGKLLDQAFTIKEKHAHVNSSAALITLGQHYLSGLSAKDNGDKKGIHVNRRKAAVCFALAFRTGDEAALLELKKITAPLNHTKLQSFIRNISSQRVDSEDEQPTNWHGPSTSPSEDRESTVSQPSIRKSLQDALWRKKIKPEKLRVDLKQQQEKIADLTTLRKNPDGPFCYYLADQPAIKRFNKSCDQASNDVEKLIMELSVAQRLSLLTEADQSLQPQAEALLEQVNRFKTKVLDEKFQAVMRIHHEMTLFSAQDRETLLAEQADRVLALTGPYDKTAVKRAYRNLALATHPDKWRDSDLESTVHAVNQFLNQARNVCEKTAEVAALKEYPFEDTYYSLHRSYNQCQARRFFVSSDEGLKYTTEVGELIAKTEQLMTQSQLAASNCIPALDSYKTRELSKLQTNLESAQADGHFRNLCLDEAQRELASLIEDFELRKSEYQVLPHAKAAARLSSVKATEEFLQQLQADTSQDAASKGRELTRFLWEQYRDNDADHCGNMRLLRWAKDQMGRKSALSEIYHELAQKAETSEAFHRPENRQRLAPA